MDLRKNKQYVVSMMVVLIAVALCFSSCREENGAVKQQKKEHPASNIPKDHPAH